ncbi:MAG: hypothetical protein ACRDSJ_20650 [Rubrobacteraceae bacterium]
MSEKGPRMILCAGLQSGGTTLISWCFLQRPDADGVLDMPNDVIQTSFEKAKEPILWVKQTVGSFRWLDMCETYRDLGWDPEPLLVVRDARAAYSSLRKKFYGINGTTAEDPPFRIRFRRFLRDWELFRENGWPIFKFEDFLRDHRAVLMEMCADLSIPWDESMVSWPKERSEIAYARGGQETFEKSFESGGLKAAKLDDRAELRIDGLPASELEWLEETFAQYNEFHGYPKEVPPAPDAPATIPAPGYEHTARAWYYGENDRLNAEYWKLVEENEELRRKVNELFAMKRGREW